MKSPCSALANAIPMTRVEALAISNPLRRPKQVSIKGNIDKVPSWMLCFASTSFKAFATACISSASSALGKTMPATFTKLLALAKTWRSAMKSPALGLLIRKNIGFFKPAASASAMFLRASSLAFKGTESSKSKIMASASPSCALASNSGRLPGANNRVRYILMGWLSITY